MASACNPLSRSNGFRAAALLGIMGQNRRFVRGSPAPRLSRRRPQSNDDDDDDDGDDDDDIDSDGEDGIVTHQSTTTNTHTSTSSSPVQSTSVPTSHTSSLPNGTPANLPDGLPASFTGSWPTTLPSGWPTTWPTTWSNSRTTPGSLPTSSSGDTSAGSNAAISETEGSFSKGSIAGIVIGSGVALVIAFFVARCMKRRRAMAKMNQLERTDLLLGPPTLRSAHLTDTKNSSMTTANLASSRPSALNRSASRDTLPQIPYDTPAYMSTDNLASYRYAEMHGRGTSTGLSYYYPSDLTDMTESSTIRESDGGFGHASLHEDMLRRQKALEAHLDRMHEAQSAPSEWSHSNVTMNPPPRYQDP